ncbi:hypothetical protein ACF3MZ_09975 [Paenibacillaceae bacterium WGS1546]|uniref:hypothetical protein n=1 Tax=Cohnella sp. WGS1546 TaxID=3366810 RepID=UPI00372D084F
MNTTTLLIVTLIIMAAAAILTLQVGATIGNKEDQGAYASSNRRRWGRLLVFYILAIVAVLAVFFLFMRT